MMTERDLSLLPDSTKADYHRVALSDAIDAVTGAFLGLGHFHVLTKEQRRDLERRLHESSDLNDFTARLNGVVAQEELPHVWENGITVIDAYINNGHLIMESGEIEAMRNWVDKTNLIRSWINCVTKQLNSH